MENPPSYKDLGLASFQEIKPYCEKWLTIDSFTNGLFLEYFISELANAVTQVSVTLSKYADKCSIVLYFPPYIPQYFLDHELGTLLFSIRRGFLTFAKTSPKLHKPFEHHTSYTAPYTSLVTYYRTTPQNYQFLNQFLNTIPTAGPHPS